MRKFECLELNCSTIICDNLKLKDNVITSDLRTSGEQVKKLYEQQYNTNCFSNIEKQFLNSLMQANKTLLPVSHYTTNKTQTGYASLCTDDHKNLFFKYNDEIYYLPKFTQYINVNFKIENNIIKIIFEIKLVPDKNIEYINHF